MRQQSSWRGCCSSCTHWCPTGMERNSPSRRLSARLEGLTDTNTPLTSQRDVFFPSTVYVLIPTDGVAPVSELVSVPFLFPPAPPDHLLAAPGGEHHLTKSAHPGDSAEGLTVFTRQNRSHLVFDSYLQMHRACLSLCLLYKVFGSTMGQDLILEFTMEMFTMKQFEQVGHSADMCPLLSLCACLTLSLPPPSPLCLPALSPQPVAFHHWLVQLR